MGGRYTDVRNGICASTPCVRRGPAISYHLARIDVLRPTRLPRGMLRTCIRLSIGLAPAGVRSRVSTVPLETDVALTLTSLADILFRLTESSLAGPFTQLALWAVSIAFSVT